MLVIHKHVYNRSTQNYSKQCQNSVPQYIHSVQVIIYCYFLPDTISLYKIAGEMSAHLCPISHFDFLLITSAIQISGQSRVRFKILIQGSDSILTNFIIPLVEQTMYLALWRKSKGYNLRVSGVLHVALHM